MRSGKQLLAGPYLVWIIGFIILPVFAVLYYALTNSAGSFTMENIAAIAEPVHLKALFLALKLAVICATVAALLSLAMILSNLEDREEHNFVNLSLWYFRCGWYASYFSMADLLSNNGIINSPFKNVRFFWDQPDEYPDRCRIWYGL